MFQLLSVVGTMNVTWPQSLQTFFGVAKLFAFEVDVLSPVRQRAASTRCAAA
jgi:hypothetical protein